MKPHTSTCSDIRRHPEGSIDLDFYRAYATALRGQAMRDAATLRSAGTLLLTAVGLFAAVLLVAANTLGRSQCVQLGKRGYLMMTFLTTRRVAIAAAGGLLAALTLSGAAQAITDTVFRYSSPKTGFLMLSPADFVVQHYSSNAVNVNHVSSEFGISTTSNAQVCFLAPVHLPQGATIKLLRAFYRRPNASDVVFVFLRRNDVSALVPQGVANEARTIAPVTAGGAVTYAANASTSIVSNRHSYYVTLCIANGGVLLSARIEYTYTHAGD